MATHIAEEPRTATIVIPGHLPGTNEIVAEAKRHPMKYSSFKKKHTNLVHWCAKGKARFTRKVNVIITWYCENRLRDQDNIMGGQKFIFDGLVAAGVLADDRWKQIGSIAHHFEVDKKKPRVEITLTEVKEAAA
jgi:Holliday junction resolvase RusA-like endonuclease